MTVSNPPADRGGAAASAPASASASPRPAAEGRGLSPATRRIALIVSGTFFIEQLDTTIIATAIPDIARSLGTEPLHLNLAMTAYMLGLAIVVPASGRLADRFGTRTVFAAATGLFLLASLLCALAGSAGTLIAARFLQGVGGAMMAPVGRLIVMRTAGRAELVEAMAWVMLPAMVAPMIGPAVGGLIVTWASWHWVFLINLPLGLVAIALILRCVPEERIADAAGIDGGGTLLVGGAFACATLACEGLAGNGVGLGMGLAGAVGLLAVGTGLFVGYLRHARRHAAPVIDLGLLRSPVYRGAMLGGSIYRIAVGDVPFLLPVALQVAHGFSALASGLVVLLPAVGGFAMKFFSTTLLRRHGFRRSLVGHGVLSVGFLALLAVAGMATPAIDAGWPLSAAVAGVLVAFGLSRSLLMNAYGTLAYAEIPRERMASATSFFLAIQNLTVGLGVAFSALGVRLAQGAWPVGGAALHFAVAFGALALCAAASVAVSLRLQPDAGAELLGRPRASPAGR